MTIEKTGRERVEAVLAKLPDRDQKVLRLRFGFDGQPLTLQEISDILSREGDGVDISREQVRRLEGRALRKLRYPTRLLRLRDIEIQGDAPEYRLLKAIFGR
jgi:RNA polymerase primary sigma factor